MYIYRSENVVFIRGDITLAKGTNQKLKLIYLMKIMLEKTDDKHGLTRTEIEQELERYGVTAERKSLYDDFEALRVFGIGRV